MPINLHGKEYFTVAERLGVAHAEKRPAVIQSVLTDWVTLPTGVLCVATITFEDGRSFRGHAEVPVNSTKSAEKDAPHECAETSSVGRALAMAGYPGNEDGLAGAEEVQRPPRRDAASPRAAWPVEPQSEDAFAGLDDVPEGIKVDTERMKSTPARAPQSQQQRPTAVPAPSKGGDFISDPQVRLISVLLKKLKKDMPGDINEYTKKEASDYIGALQKQEAGG